MSEPSRSESEAERVWKVASGTWEACGAKATAGVRRGHSSGEAGQCPWVSPERSEHCEAMSLDEFRYVRDRHYCKGDRYLEWCPSNKSVKKVCRKIKEETMRRKLLLPVEGVIRRLSLVLDGWGRYFKCGYPSRQFAKVNAYARYRLYKFLNRKSQRRYRLKYAETYYGELQKLGLIALTRRRYR